VTTGLNGQVIEWDLLTHTPKAKYNAHTPIWESKMHGKYIYLASEDGSVKVAKVKKARIEYVRTTLARVGESRCLSIELVTEGSSEKSLVK
jgi:hypothetical protein